MAKLLSHHKISWDSLRKIKVDHYEYGYNVDKELWYDCRPYERNDEKICREYLGGIGSTQKYAIRKLR